MIQLIHSDCIEAMKGMEPCTVDSIVTDPPYGLSFMGKDWDHGVPGVHFWEEALRVAKPGAHLLAFGGTRTFHRLACAIEDAGWEMRDTLMFIYGSGFPKSHNLKRVFCCCDETAEQKAQHGVRLVRAADLSQGIDTEEERGEALFPSVPEQGPSAHGAARSEPEPSGCEQPGLEGRGDDLQKEGQLHEHPLSQSAEVDSTDGPKGRLHNGAPAGNGEDLRAATGTDGSSPSQEPQPDGERPGEPGNVAKQPRSQAGGSGKVCSRCGKPVPPFPVSGFGTSLKPAFEPILLARKPLEGTVLQNVLTHGTGAINVDGCRVEANGEKIPCQTSSQPSPNGFLSGLSLDYKGRREYPDTPQGRWPANVIHDGSDEVVGMFPEQSSPGPYIRASTDQTKSQLPGHVAGEWNMGRGDSGSAARFFYCAKASKADRDEGLERFAIKHKRILNGGIPSAINSDPRGMSGGGDRLARNNHPTVKPTDLMRYLCRLVTPPKGTVFDLFMGSGSTGKAAMMEGFSFIGMDKEKEYVDIARARIEHAQRKEIERQGLFAEIAAA